MPDFRVHCDPPAAAAASLTLSADESHHLVTVNRARVGDTVIAFDGAGREWRTEVIAAGRRQAVLAIKESLATASRPGHVTLAQALPKGPTMDTIVRKATELGAARIIPVESARTQVHLDADRSDRKQTRWHTAALEAAKQCGNPWLPRIDGLASFADALAAAADSDLRLIASLGSGALTFRAAFAQASARPGHGPRRVFLLVGPEGDFTAEETALALKAGFVPVTLGPLVLRCDTAALAALSVVNHELQQDLP